jgi:hypothetical protein
MVRFGGVTDFAFFPLFEFDDTDPGAKRDRPRNSSAIDWPRGCSVMTKSPHLSAITSRIFKKLGSRTEARCWIFAANSRRRVGLAALPVLLLRFDPAAGHVP